MVISTVATNATQEGKNRRAAPPDGFFGGVGAGGAPLAGVVAAAAGTMAPAPIGHVTSSEGVTAWRDKLCYVG